jgi:CRP/FNR family transcriptional regulator, cyclic AMP receptor protein
MDTSSFFTYPTRSKADERTPVSPATGIGLMPSATAEEWDALLAATETLRFGPGDVVLKARERDRALYLLLDGRLEIEGADTTVSAPAAVGVAAFLDDLPRAVTLHARTHGELARMSWDAYEALSARDARLGRTILLDLARDLAARLRAVGAGLPGWTG